jgi:cation diffusion facilitator family transporter
MSTESHSLQKKTLFILLIINVVMFFIELSAGLIADSTALIADSLDMFADASVYGISIFAVGQSAKKKAGVAIFSGIIELLMGVAAANEVIERFMYGSQPQSLAMILIGCLALAANIWCVMLISRYRNGDIHMQASYIFSKNDVIANVGVVLSGILVAVIGSNIPDLLIGAVIAAVVIKGGVTILQRSIDAFRVG